MEYLLQPAGNEHTTVRVSRSQHGSVYHTETTGASDTRKNSPAIRGVPRRHAWRSASTTKRSGSLEGKWETMNVAERPDTLNKMFSRNQSRPIPQHVHCRALFQRNDLKNCLHSTTTTKRMSRLALMHIHKDTELDAERIIHQKNRRILFRHE